MYIHGVLQCEHIQSYIFLAFRCCCCYYIFVVFFRFMRCELCCCWCCWGRINCKNYIDYIDIGCEPKVCATRKTIHINLRLRVCSSKLLGYVVQSEWNKKKHIYTNAMHIKREALMRALKLQFTAHTHTHTHSNRNHTITTEENRYAECQFVNKIKSL